MTAARALFWTVMAVWGVLEVRTSIVRRGSDTGEDEGSQRLALAGVLGGLAAALVLDRATSPFVPEHRQAPFLVAGAAVVAGGIALRIWSIRTLGRFFTYHVMTTTDQHVVTSGPYRRVRHPSYTALFVSCVGAGISTANVRSIVAAIVLPLVGLGYRIKVEERAMSRALGDEYARFCATRKRLIPGVW